MSDQTTAIHQDMLDIIFAQRNRAYGAYALRRSYPKYVRNALLMGVALIGLAFAFPYILGAVRSIEQEKPIEVIVDMGPPPNVDPNDVPTPPPPPPTPPPPTRTTVTFVPPVIRKDDEVQEQEPQKTVEELQTSTADIGKVDAKGTDDAPPAIIDNPEELKVIEEVKAPPPPEKTYEMFDIHKTPSFPGGEKELMKYLSENIKYPPLARENNIQGKVVLQFVVGKDGAVNDISMLRDIGGGCGKEAIRVVGSMPKWIPGEANGNPVKVRFTLPVQFKLE